MKMDPEPTADAKPRSKVSTIVVIVVILFVAAVLYWFLVMREERPTVAEPPASEDIESPDLGSEIFERGSNPVGGELPETVVPVPNPLEGAYENPFGE